MTLSGRTAIEMMVNSSASLTARRSINRKNALRSRKLEKASGVEEPAIMVGSGMISRVRSEAFTGR